MDRLLCTALQEQFDKTISIFSRLVTAFSDEQWEKGFSGFQVPAKVAYHAIDSLDYFFSKEPDHYKWGHKFGLPWWKIEQGNLPTKEQVLQYTEEVATRVNDWFNSCDDSGLTAILDDEKVITKVIYALRHTMHHQGGLNALAAYHKINVSGWDDGT